ncbi:MAG TPA: ATP phosphoribosyltransferase regulatory subunit, partial [Patescibacteria group bacterium]|nr:ATP phosphoribosyltransferase regulatory subunit [Patescibacteria group bacterium]
MADKTPQLLKGFRDFGPQQQTARFDMFAKIRAAFERYGFAPVDTPAIEYASTLTGKYGADEKLMYRFRDQGDRDVALRYDLTVPFARYYLANRNDLPKPFKRYQIAPVWR